MHTKRFQLLIFAVLGFTFSMILQGDSISVINDSLREIKLVATYVSDDFNELPFDQKEMNIKNRGYLADHVDSDEYELDNNQEEELLFNKQKRGNNFNLYRIAVSDPLGLVESREEYAEIFEPGSIYTARIESSMGRFNYDLEMSWSLTTTN